MIIAIFSMFKRDIEYTKDPNCTSREKKSEMNKTPT